MFDWLKANPVEKSEQSITALVAELIRVANRAQRDRDQTGKANSSDVEGVHDLQKRLNAQLRGPIPLDRVKAEFIDPPLQAPNVSQAAKTAILHVYDSAVLALSGHTPSGTEGSAAFRLGLAYQDQRLWAQAASAFAEAVRDEPADFVSWYNLALAYVELERPDEALLPLREALGRKPDWPEALSTLGYLYNQKREWAMAFEVLTKAVDLGPDLSDAWFNLGITLLYSRRHEGNTLALILQRLEALDRNSAVQFAQALRAQGLL